MCSKAESKVGTISWGPSLAMERSEIEWEGSQRRRPWEATPPASGQMKGRRRPEALPWAAPPAGPGLS
jgi:hypothetical protein